MASTGTNGPHVAAEDIYKAKFEVKWRLGDEQDIHTVEKIKVKYKFNGDEYVKEVNIANKRTHKGYFLGHIELDITDLNNHFFTYTDTPSYLDIEFFPVVTGVSDENLGSRIFRFNPMFNVRRVGLDTNVCSNGWYSGNISAFARVEFISALKRLKDGGVAFRCNDFSLPWGGPFKLSSSWYHGSGHTRGMDADIRYFNENSTAQDFYDLENAKERVKDLNLYLKLSEWANKIAAALTPEDALKKADLHSKCTDPIAGYKPPCNALTTVNDLTHEKILQLCQWNGIGFAECDDVNTAGYYAAIVRYSKWVEYNITNLRITGGTLKPLMGGGVRRKPEERDGLTLNYNWQHLAINQGLWPDGSRVYLQTGGEITENFIHSCHEYGCGFGLGKGKEFDPKDEVHFNHIHFKLRE